MNIKNFSLTKCNDLFNLPIEIFILKYKIGYNDAKFYKQKFIEFTGKDVSLINQQKQKKKTKK